MVPDMDYVELENEDAGPNKRRDELSRYVELFRAAFAELHDAVRVCVSRPGQYLSPHNDYPRVSKLASGFPFFTDVGFYDERAPKDYVGTVRPRGLAGLFSGTSFREVNLPKGAELASFLRSHDFGRKLNLSYNGIATDRPVDMLVANAVERYLHLYGVDSPIETRRRDSVILPLIRGTFFQKLELRLVVPIALTHFSFDHFRLTETTYITRIPKKLQLARARMSTLGSGAVKMVVGAATHAFVSNGWEVILHDVDDVSKALSQSPPNVLDAIDSFFAALRIVTGIKTGYAQILWLPRRWALDYFCDLTPVYGATVRRYPSDYDHYGWTERGDEIAKDQRKEIQRIYGSIVDNEGEGLRLALGRLNACLTRTDAADAILDGTIGLELLLGDDQNQSLAYKLRMRAAALAVVRADAAYTPATIAAQVKRLYEARSAIVHGRRKKRTKLANESVSTRYASERQISSDLLRFALSALLTHPEYQDPAKIDEGVLLRGDQNLNQGSGGLSKPRRKNKPKSSKE